MLVKATPEDVSQIVALVNSAYRGDTSKAGWTTEADLLDGQRVDESMILEMITQPQSEIWIKKDQRERSLNEIIGCVFLEKKSPFLYLGMLTVSPRLQSTGLGSQILSFAESRCKDLQLNGIEITVIQSRTELIAWYVKKGFHQTGNFVAFPEEKKFGIQKLQ